MHELTEMLKAAGGNQATLVLVVLGWIAREVVALRRSIKGQGQRLGALATKITRCETALNIKPTPDDGAS